ncbi:SlyX family protein [Burkholderiaceae bacterium DAT-1]|nr:SlyX family protein [Burkholderiaceae bacterium DAT-1]
MNEPSTDDRITELEIRLALQDDLVDELNRMVATQQRQLEWLYQEMKRLQDMQRANPGQSGISLRDEIPPHY